MSGLDLLTGDIFSSFPEGVQNTADAEWRAFADIINAYRDELVDGNGSAISGINDFDNIYRPEKFPISVLYQLADMLKVRYKYTESDLSFRKKIASAEITNRWHATAKQIGEYIQAVTGIAPGILYRTDTSTGWDETNTVILPEFDGGILWDETDAYLFFFPAFVWAAVQAGILIDVKNNGVYTVDQLTEIYQIVAQYKNAELAADVGYVDTITGAPIALKTIYSTELTMTSFPSNIDPGE